MENEQIHTSSKDPAERLLSVVVAALEDAKARDMTSLDVTHLTSITDYLVICSGTSSRHLKTIAETAMEKVRSAGFEILGHEGGGVSEWVVVDCGDVVLHVMSPQAREFYNLENLWGMDRQQEAESKPARVDPPK